jgi:hypothetical protein
MPSARRDRTRTSPCRSCSLEAELASLPHLRPEELGLSDLETAQAIGKSRTFFAQARAHSRIDLHTQRMIALVRHWINTTNRHTGGLPRKQPRFRSSWWSLCNTWMPCAAGREPERRRSTRGGTACDPSPPPIDAAKLTPPPAAQVSWFAGDRSAITQAFAGAFLSP